ncbi:MAG: phosphonate C-P lyase system protein PhnK [Cyanobacteria bacterium J06592_8]
MNKIKSLLTVENLSKSYDFTQACQQISFNLYAGQVIGIVGESGSGKTTLLRLISGLLPIDTGKLSYVNPQGTWLDLQQISESHRRQLMRTEWGFVQQNPREGLRMNITVGANIGERLMSIGVRNYSKIRQEIIYWLEQVEIDTRWMDELPSTLSGGMQQRLQIARVLVTQPRLVFMDEPTGGLDVSVQAKLLDLLRSLVINLNLSVILVTHDIGVVRLLAHRLFVMKNGKIIEAGLTDQVLDDPQHPYTQQLVSATLTP